MDSQAIEIELVTRAQAGDADAFNRLCTRLQPLVLRFVRRLIRHAEVVEDIVQDTFVALYAHLASLDPPGRLRPYLFRIARNLCYDELRRRGRLEPLAINDDPIPFADATSPLNDVPASPDEVMHWLSLYLEVQSAMERLPEAHRMTLILFAEEALSYTEIAEAMRTSIGTVKSRIFYARKALRLGLRPEVVQVLDEALRETTPKGSEAGTGRA